MSQFAKDQLQKHGWKEGSGLGKEETGIKEAIKVKIKNDTHGVGHNRGDEFTFHWWDHVFNKAASSISVENSEEGVCVKKTSDSLEGPIQNKKVKTFNNKQMLYGKFVKGATLANNEELEEQNDNESDSEDDNSDDDDKQKLNKLKDEEILELCGGMTAHKAARHGHKLNGKLLRIQEQEQLLYDKYSKKLQKGTEREKGQKNTKPSKDLSNEIHDTNSELTNGQASEELYISVKKKKKSKKNKSKDKNKHDEMDISSEANSEVVGERTLESSKRGDKKKRKFNEDIDINEDLSNCGEEKSSKKKLLSNSLELVTMETEENSTSSARKIKKRKKEKVREAEKQETEPVTSDNENEIRKKKKKSKKNKIKDAR